MNFTCNKEELAKAVSIASRAVSRMQGSILECILFECLGDELTLKATDISLSVKITIPADVKESGSAAVASRSLYDIISKLPSADINLKRISKSQIELKCLNSKIKLAVTDEDEFPEFPEPNLSNIVKISQKNLRNMIDTTIFAAATSEDKPILTGLYFDSEPGSLTLVGLDGYRMAVRKSNTISKTDLKCTVPARALKEAARSLSDSEDEVEIIMDESLIAFEWDKIKIYSRLLDGNYVNYKKLIPDEFKTDVKADTENLKDAIERAQVLARDGNNVVALDISETVMNITSESELGSIDENLNIEGSGSPLKIGFNTKYMLDVIKNIPESEITMKFNTPITPCVVKKDGEQSYIYLILPVQLRD